MAKNNKRTLYIGIGAVVVIAIVVGIIIAVTRGSGNNNEGDGTNQSTVYTAGDFTPIQQSIEFGDYNAMCSLAKEIQNGEAIGKIVEIDGYVSHPGTKYSIVQKNGDGTKSIGTEFVIEGNNGLEELIEHVMYTKNDAVLTERTNSGYQIYKSLGE